MNDFIVTIVPTVLIIGVVGLSLALFLLAIHDLIVIRRKAKPKRLLQPKITVVVMSTGSVNAAQDCLMSLRRSRYRKLDIVVVGAKGHRTEHTQVKKLAKKYVHVGYYQPRKEYAHSKLIHEAYKRSERGSIVIVIDSHMVVTREAIDNSARLGESGKVIRLQPSNNDYGLTGVIMSLKGSAYRMFIKLISVLHIPMPAMQRHGGYVLASSLVTTNQRKYFAWAYDDSKVTVVHSRLSVVPASGVGIKAVSGLVGLAAIVAIALVMIQVAIEGKGLEALTISWLLIAIAAALLVLFDTHTSTRQKIETVVCFGFMPIMVLIAYVTSINYDTSS